MHSSLLVLPYHLIWQLSLLKSVLFMILYNANYLFLSMFSLFFFFSVTFSSVCLFYTMLLYAFLSLFALWIQCMCVSIFLFSVCVYIVNYACVSLSLSFLSVDSLHLCLLLSIIPSSRCVLIVPNSLCLYFSPLSVYSLYLCVCVCPSH